MTQRPDIVFIVLDTQRADRLGCYGYETAITPHLDQFASQSALFKMGISPAQWTIPSHASMFTGLYPTVHQVTQSYTSLSKEQPQLAELMAQAGYETVAFCNNPLVGILDNGFKRGFEAFHNYGGATPNAWHPSAESPSLGRRMANTLEAGFRRFADPIQSAVTHAASHSDLAFRLFLNQWVTPIWARLANFKGQNERSVRHLTQFFADREQKPNRRPLFLFLNLMETHLPFLPPAEAIDRVAPWLRQDEAAMAEMRRWNREAYRWAAPLAEPLTDIESRTLNALYDAEVTYQDGYLAQLFAQLGRRANVDNTLTIIVGDHGDGLGEHDMVGHAFNAYQELVHVPLMVNWPQHVTSAEVETPVSTRRVYHTMLAAAGVDWLEGTDPAKLSLLETIDGRDPEFETAFSEIVPATNFIAALENRQPALIAKFRCDEMRRAIVQKGHKLIQISAEADELFNLQTDPLELATILGEGASAEAQALDLQLNKFAETVAAQQGDVAAGDRVDLQDERIQDQLRALGYIE